MRLLVVCASVLLQGVVAPPPSGTVTINVPGLGDIQGNVRDGCNEFLGIRYATADRFEDPKDVAAFPNPYDATFRRPMCFQQCPPVPTQVCQTEGVEEDCLYLNIFTPKDSPVDRCVMVFLHGGAFSSYSGGSLLFDGEVFVETGGCILVTLNYRLGAFGFLGTRNTAIKDQMKALEWVNTNIQYFGGDENKVTLFGQSAGAQSIGILQSIPAASDKFIRVIMQSTPITVPFKTSAQADQQEADLAAAIGCTVGDLTCYQAADPTAILAFQLTSTVPGLFLQNFEIWGPVKDGTLISQNLYEIFTSGQFDPKDTMIGTVSDEGPPYIQPLFRNPLSLTELNAFLGTVSPGLTIAALAPFYVPSNPLDTRDVLGDITTDYVFNCVSQDVGSIIRKTRKRVYNYVYKEVFPYPVWGVGNPCNDLVCHGIELPVLFGSYDLAGYPLSPSQDTLSRQMILFWTNFAKNGKPGRRGLPSWRFRYWSFFYRYRQFFLEAGNTRSASFGEAYWNSIKCSNIKEQLGFQPF